MTNISVIVPCYDRLDLFEKCLFSLVSQTLDADEYEIIVIDNNALFNVAQVIALVQRVSRVPITLTQEPKQGPAWARNRGTQIATGSIICCIDSDCIADKDWLAQLVTSFDGHTDLAGVGGQTLFFQQCHTAIEKYCDYIQMNRTPLFSDKGISSLLTNNCAFRRACLEEAGFFASLCAHPACEDLHISRRILSQGYYFQYAHTARVYTVPRKSVKDLWSTFWGYGKGEVLSNRKLFPSTQTMSFWGDSLQLLKTILDIFLMPLYFFLYLGKGRSVKECILFVFYDIVKKTSFKVGKTSAYFYHHVT